ncbi:hypothetical protein [Streptomyces sp. NPDC058252]|uniref:hypothetical protein n=1 Tax=Streptomyces sp. NPDC058252 TaxID=3346405 RepID=UPI0036E18FDD
MPLLPQTRRDLPDDLAEVESRMDRWADELGSIVGSAGDHKAVLSDCKDRLHRLRRGFQDARESTHAQAS